jgi:hypothetical protein
MSFASQWAKPASYGKFHGADAAETAKWERCGLIDQRLGHMLSDAGPTLCGFAACYALLLTSGAPDRAAVPVTAASAALAALWLLHYLHRGVVHPLLMRYRAPRVPALITLAGLLPNSLFSWLNASAIACLEPAVAPTWHADPRFGVGVAVYAVGFIINRSSDWKLRWRAPRVPVYNCDNLDSRSLRAQRSAASRDAEGGGAQQAAAYHVPHGGVFTYVSCANYLGELVQWGGWALASWSWAALLWWLFALSTFVPRARQTHAWYRATFPDYPSQRKALIPFVW